MLFPPLLIDVRQRRDGAGGACEFADVLRGEQHAGVSAASAFIHVHQLLLHVRQLGQPLQLDAGQTIRGLTQRLLGFCGLGRGLLGLLGLQIALDLELPEIADERTLFVGQSIG